MSTNSPFVLFLQILIFNASFAEPAVVSGFCPARAWYAPSDCSWDDGAINSPGLSFGVSNCDTIFGQFTSQAASTATDSPINEEASTAPDCGPGGIATRMSTNSPFVLFVQKEQTPSIERALLVRASHNQRLPGVSAVPRSPCDLAYVILGIRELVRDVFPGKLKKLLPTAEHPTSISIPEVIRDEFLRAFLLDAPVDVATPEEPMLTYAANARRPPPAA
ncbi:hypothetical protein HPB47_015617 [Ixodes persulcatus]|uniref:Uncharacterized protein n=1 Tax=Ixodes persulcatus TaxID=34615 RepID=A0AC60QT00_IXOPE|nr:hypothetical protein HPB47_015617 [Ixodes persulcatus]